MTHAPPSRAINCALAMLLAAACTVAIYFAGLHGPFLLDDTGNLEPLQRWLRGELNWRAVIFGNRSGPGGRPLSMLSFLLDVMRTGTMDSSTFKPTNLALHLACGALVFALSHAILKWVFQGKWSVTIGAAFIALAWLWMPIQVSTVLYTVQRMAQLSAFFTFSALLAYMHARLAMLRDQRYGAPLLWVGVPMFTLLATLSKENGLLALPLSAVIEFTLFNYGQRPRQIKAFLLFFVGLPFAAGVILILINPGWITRDYANRDFTLMERLLTEPRILWGYLRTSFIPLERSMGIFHDNYPVSTSLSSPLSTAFSLAAWASLVVAALATRRKAPLFSLGVLGYLVAMALESGPVALELYFEHRNYGPVFFALLAIAGLLHPLLTHRRIPSASRRVMMAGGCAMLGLYATGSFSQVRTWSDEDVFYANQYEDSPTSPRLLSVLSARAMVKHDLQTSLRLLNESENAGPPSERATTALWKIMAYCEAGQAVPPIQYDELDERAEGRITTYAMMAWELMANRLHKGCGNIDMSRISATGARWLRSVPQPATAQQIWRTRYNVGRIMADSGDIPGARKLVSQAWQDSQHNNGIGVLLFRLNASLGDSDACRRVLSVLEHHNSGDDKSLNDAVRTFREALEHDEIGKNA